MKRFLWGLVLAGLMSATSPFSAFGESVYPENIRIGLSFNDSNSGQAVLSSQTGFEFGIVEDNVYRNLYYLMDFDELEVEKASPTVDEDAFLVQAGPVFEDLEGLYEHYDSIRGEDEPFFFVYDRGWQICTGPYGSLEEAEAERSRLQADIPASEFCVNAFNTLVLVKSEGGTLLAYDSMEAEYLLKPFKEKDGEAVFSYKGRQYRGGALFKRFYGSDLTVVNYLGMQEYLYGVLPKEMAKDWPLEALKAQAVAARNFAIANYGKYAHIGFNLCNTSASQVYGGYDFEGPVSNRAVDETEGRVLTWNGQIVSAFYHSSSGGYTESSENVWSLELPYIKGIRDDFSTTAPYAQWKIDYSKGMVVRTLRTAGYDVGDSIDLSILSWSENNHVIDLLVESEKPDVVISKNAIRTVFGYNTLRSTLFDIKKDNDLYKLDVNLTTERVPAKGLAVMGIDGKIERTDSETCHIMGAEAQRENRMPQTFVFEGGGWGHGLGMSQWGAKKMAEEGYDYRQILSFYYKDTIVE